MKKGELKKQEIIRTAETLFCRYGYEATSVQDILDALHTSKGSFYHHFLSKEALLEEICRSRSSSSSEKISELVSSSANPEDKLNGLLSEMIPFSGEKLSFLMMLLPVFLLPEGTSLRLFYSRELSSMYRGAVSSVLREGTEKSCFFCTDSDFFADIVLQLVTGLWLSIVDMILQNEQSGTRTDPSDLLSLSEQYQFALERLIVAPFGSVSIVCFSDLYSLIGQIHQHWKKNSNG